MEEKDAGFKPMSHHRDEERYFYEKDRELVKALREQANEERVQQEREQERAIHWMRCPKCGAPMEEIQLELLFVERCRTCRGVYFDDGELAILRKLELEGQRGAGDFLSRLIREIGDR